MESTNFIQLIMIFITSYLSNVWRSIWKYKLDTVYFALITREAKELVSLSYWVPNHVNGDFPSLGMEMARKSRRAANRIFEWNVYSCLENCVDCGHFIPGYKSHRRVSSFLLERRASTSIRLFRAAWQDQPVHQTFHRCLLGNPRSKVNSFWTSLVLWCGTNRDVRNFMTLGLH